MLLQDIRYAVRSLRKSPGFTLVAVACLSLGIGINAGIFSIIDGVLINPYPFPEPVRLILLNSTRPQRGITWTSVSYPDFRDWRDENTTLADIAAFTRRSLTIADGRSDPERFDGALVSWNMFRLLGATPALGREFRAEDDRRGAEPVVMISDEVWKGRYAADPSIVGRSILVNGRPHAVIGVMPPGFMFPGRERLWVTVAPYEDEFSRRFRNMGIFARLKPGVSREQAEADLKAVAARLETRYPLDNEGWSAVTRPLRSWLVPADVEMMLIAMMGAVTLVLMIACANIANLLLARASVRAREIAIRSALGAGKWRIIRQLLTEAVVIGLASAPLGILVAWIALNLVDRGIPPEAVPYFIRWSLDGRALAYTMAISVATGIVFGLAPAIQAGRANLHSSLKEGGRGAAGGSRARLRSSLVVAEIAMAIVLLIGASLFVRSFLNLQHRESGFDTGTLMTMRIYLPGSAYETPEGRRARIEDVVRRIEALPGVEWAFASNFIPYGGGSGGGSILVEGKAVDPGQEPQIAFVAATPHLRRTLGVPLVRGRDLTDTEEALRSPVALINQMMADEIWPGEDPIGRRFRLTSEATPDWFTVVGVVGNFQHFVGDSDRPYSPSAYVPYAFNPTLNTGLTIRVAGEPSAITSAVREQVRQSDAALPVFSARTMEQLRQLSFWEFKLFGWMFSVFGAVALVLASIGVYGVLSYSVSQRVQEIGVRVALGAGRGDVLRLIVGYGMKLAAVGVVLGLVGSAAANQFVKTILYNVTPTDPVSFILVSAFLTLVALGASYLPARRALAVDPIIALRNE